MGVSHWDLLNFSNVPSVRPRRDVSLHALTMILYQLRCGKDHEFEAWFKDGQTCERQLTRKSIECPVCGNRKVAKALMAPRIGASDKKQPLNLPAKPPVDSQQPMSVMATTMRQHLQEVRAKIEENCDYVGDKF